MSHRCHKFAGFSLLEMLVAIMILGVGLIMVAAVFPVAGDWTRAAVEQTVVQSVAQNALAIIKSKYEAGGQDLMANGNLNSGAVGVLPGMDSIPLNERGYQFGADTPFPTEHPENCTYFWTALARKNPGSGQMLDVYILVFRKGAAEQTFTRSGEGWSGVGGEPALVPEANLVAFDPASPPMRVGEYGIGAQSGTVFRLLAGQNGTASASPGLSSADAQVWYSPAADGTSASPLVYVFQTTLSY